jgi:hypothetical protein
MIKLAGILLIFCSAATFSPLAIAAENEGFFIDPHIAVGYNVAQGTHVLFGLDGGYALTERLSAGVGAYYSAGEHPDDDREMGAGPFVTYFHPLTSFLIAHVREDVDYIDQRDPVQIPGTTDYTHTTETGVASVTTAGLHLLLTSNLGISGGYRLVFPLSNTDLGKDRSGFYLGFSIGI